jgi:hypothetical protein
MKPLLYKPKSDLYCCYLYPDVDECVCYYNDPYCDHSNIKIINLKDRESGENKKHYFILLATETVSINKKFKIKLANVITSDCKSGWIDYQFIEEVK